MQKLGAIDANFLYTETDLIPNHVASVQRFELPEGVFASDYIEGLRSYLTERVHLVPYLQRKLKLVPGNLDHPFWVHADDFDINRHVVEVPVEAPGSLAQLEKKIGELHSINMDRSRPLWTIHVLTGLEDGTVAFYNQVHHAAIDGIAGQMATMILFDNTPEHPPVTEAGAVPAEEDSMASLIQMTLENLLMYQVGSTSRMLGGMESMRRMFQRAIDPSRTFGAFAERAPKTRFNNQIGKARSYAVGDLPMSDIRGMGKQLGCTVNDVFMAVCSGALRRYLQRKEELPATGLIAGCPVSLRRPGDKNMGNQVTMMNVNLATEVEDPKLRLLAIHQSAVTAKEVTADMADAFDANMALPGLPAMVAMATAAAETSRMADRVPAPPVNVVISNVPGPREELFANGARMLTHYPVSIPTHGIGLNITVQSYQSRMYFGVTACANALPDADVLRDDMIAAFLELRQVLLPNNVSTFKAPVAATKPVAKASVSDVETKVA